MSDDLETHIEGTVIQRNLRRNSQEDSREDLRGYLRSTSRTTVNCDSISRFYGVVAVVAIVLVLSYSLIIATNQDMKEEPMNMHNEKMYMHQETPSNTNMKLELNEKLNLLNERFSQFNETFNNHLDNRLDALDNKVDGLNISLNNKIDFIKEELSTIIQDSHIGKTIAGTPTRQIIPFSVTLNKPRVNLTGRGTLVLYNNDTYLLTAHHVATDLVNVTDPITNQTTNKTCYRKLNIQVHPSQSFKVKISNESYPEVITFHDYNVTDMMLIRVNVIGLTQKRSLIPKISNEALEVGQSLVGATFWSGDNDIVIGGSVITRNRSCSVLTDVCGRPGFSGTGLFTQNKLVAVYKGSGTADYSLEETDNFPAYVDSFRSNLDEERIFAPFKRECNLTAGCFVAVHQIARNPTTMVTDASCFFSSNLKYETIIDMSKDGCPP